MIDKDFQKRRMFAQSNSKKGIEYWTKDIAFYLDGVSFVYKGNPLSDVVKPKSRIWRKRQEGLQITTKGSKDLAGGRRLQLIVAIAYGRGVICAEPYERMSGKYFARFIRRNFPILESRNCLSWTTIPRRHQQKQSVPCVMRNAKWSKYQLDLLT